MHFLTEAEIACFKKLFLATVPVDRNHPGLPTLLDRGWATCNDDGRASITKDGRDIAVFNMGWERGDEAGDPRARYHW